MYFRAKTLGEALGGLGGVTSIMNNLLGNIQPILNLIFLLKFAEIMLNIYKKEYFNELDKYVQHAFEMLTRAERMDGQRYYTDQNYPLNRKETDETIEDRKRRRKRLFLYLKWFKQERIPLGQAFNNDFLMQMIGEVTESYIFELEKFEQQLEDTIIQQFKTNLTIYHKRSQFDNFQLILHLFKQCSFFGVIKLVDNFQLEELRSQQQLKQTYEEFDVKIQRLARDRDLQRAENMKEIDILQVRIGELKEQKEKLEARSTDL